MIMKHLGIAAPLLAATISTASADVFLVDFRNADPSPRPAGTWNVYNVPGDMTGTLADSTGSTSANVGISYTTTTGSIAGGGNTSQFTSGPAWVAGGTSEDGAAGDYFYSSTGDGANEVMLTFSGLTAGDAVQIDLFSARDSAQARGNYAVSFDGGSSWQGFSVYESDGTLSASWGTDTTDSRLYFAREDGFTAGRYMSLSGTLASTTLQVRALDSSDDYDRGDGVMVDPYYTLNALRITTAIPEPASLALLGIGGWLCLGRRRLA